jgi:hypothetical protein
LIDEAAETGKEEEEIDHGGCLGSLVSVFSLAQEPEKTKKPGSDRFAAGPAKTGDQSPKTTIG